MRAFGKRVALISDRVYVGDMQDRLPATLRERLFTATGRAVWFLGGAHGWAAIRDTAYYRGDR